MGRKMRCKTRYARLVSWTAAARVGFVATSMKFELDPRIGRHYGDQVDFETHYDLGAHRPCIVRALAYRNRTHHGEL